MKKALGMTAKRRLYEGVFVPPVSCEAETWNMTEVDRRRLNVFEMRCLWSMLVVSNMKKESEE